ncbi:hypothetical protein CBL_00229 [Carabus blaptoides fortunei]
MAGLLPINERLHIISFSAYPSHSEFRSAVMCLNLLTAVLTTWTLLDWTQGIAAVKLVERHRPKQLEHKSPRAGRSVLRNSRQAGQRSCPAKELQDLRSFRRSSVCERRNKTKETA